MDKEITKDDMIVMLVQEKYEQVAVTNKLLQQNLDQVRDLEAQVNSLADQFDAANREIARYKEQIAQLEAERAAFIELGDGVEIRIGDVFKEGNVMSLVKLDNSFEVQVGRKFGNKTSIRFVKKSDIEKLREKLSR